MGTLRIEFYAGKTRVDAETRDPLGGQTLVVSSSATAGGSRPVVPLGALAGGTLVELEAIDAAIYVDLGPAPDPTTSPAFLILPGQPHRVLASPGDFISAILASDIVLPSTGGGGGPATIADGADVAQGAKADAAATSSTASWSVVALLKGLYALLAGVLVVRSGQLATGTATITNGTPLSAAVDLGTARLVGIAYPAAWTAAGLTFSVSADGTTYFDLYDGATERNLTVTAGKLDARPLSDWLGVRFVKLRSGTSVTPVNQAADRVFTLVTAP